VSDRGEQPVRGEPLLLEPLSTSAELGSSEPLEPAACRGAERLVRGDQRDAPADGELVELRRSPRWDDAAGSACRPPALRRFRPP